MTKEEKIAMCLAYFAATIHCEGEEFLASLTDDPAPTRPGDPLNRPIEMRLVEALEEVERARRAESAMREKLQQHIVANQRPSDPQAVELADYVEEYAAEHALLDGRDNPNAIKLNAIAAILRRAPASGITLDDVERWMRDAATMAFGDDVPIDFIGLGIVIAAMRKELGGR